MPILVILTIAVQFICCAHAVRSGREYYWIMFIVMAPWLGAGVYFFTQILPEMEHSRAANQMKTDVSKLVDPDKAYRQAAKNLEMLDTVENRVEMARQCMVREQYDDSVQLLEGALEGAHESDVAILLMAAEGTSWPETRPSPLLFRPHSSGAPGHSFRDCASSVCKIRGGPGKTEDALVDYAALVEYATGEEARCRYALLLQQTGQVEKAREQFQEVINSVDRASKHYLRAQKDWYQVAKRNL